MIKLLSPNPYGITKYAYWDDLSANPDLRLQLEKAAISYSEIQIPYIAGMGGNAALVIYTSPKTGQSVTILCVPHRPEIDSFIEDYWYCEGMNAEQAVATDWGAVYEYTRRLRP